MKLLPVAILVAIVSFPTIPRALAQEISVPVGASIQEALDKNPGRTIMLEPGDHQISQTIKISHGGSGLRGNARIIQTNPKANIIEVAPGVADAQICDLTLTRSEGNMETSLYGVFAKETLDLVIENVQVIDNRTDEGAGIELLFCEGSSIRNCLVQNYSRVTVDNRMDTPRGLEQCGYAFNVINGNGISVRHSKATLIQSNRVVEKNWIPTRENKEKYNLGKFVGKAEKKGSLVPQKMWDEEYSNAWHQGSAIIVTGPEKGDCVQLLGNYVENAAQGLDIHADHAIIANNIVNDAFIGMKAMHGARNVIITGNQFIKNSLWAIGLMPGGASHGAGDAVDNEPETNRDGYSLIANNIISDFGYGAAAWMWGTDGCPLRFDKGQLPTNPRLKAVIIQGNLVYDPGRDSIMVDGKPQIEPPRYKYAVLVHAGDDGPEDLRFSNNLFDPGRDGISNLPLNP